MEVPNCAGTSLELRALLRQVMAAKLSPPCRSVPCTLRPAVAHALCCPQGAMFWTHIYDVDIPWAKGTPFHQLNSEQRAYLDRLMRGQVRIVGGQAYNNWCAPRLFQAMLFQVSCVQWQGVWAVQVEGRWLMREGGQVLMLRGGWGQRCSLAGVPVGWRQAWWRQVTACLRACLFVEQVQHPVAADGGAA